MKATIYTEGGGEYGLGHISRCTALSEAFEEKDVKATMVIAEGGVSPSWHDGDGIIASDIAVIDSYHASDAVRATISGNAVTTFYVEDGKETLLRKAFWDVPKKDIKDAPESILITFGGSDPMCMTSKVVDIVCQKYPLMKKHVVLGPGYHGDAIVGDALTTVVTSPNVEDFRALMVSSDVAITAGGQTLYELAACGVAMVAVIVADNQQGQVSYFVKNGAALSEDDNILGAIERLHYKTLRASMAEAGYNIIADTRGARDVVDDIISGTLTLRAAIDSDSEILWRWRNDSHTRMMSKNSDEIPWKNHCEWYRDAKNVFIGIVGDDAIGTVRLDKSTVSVTVAPEFRGKGYAQHLIRMACEKSDASVIYADVKKENIASIRAFERCGFVKTDEDGDIISYKLTYERISE